MSDSTETSSTSSSSASSSSSSSKPKVDKRTALNDTALHVFKGALVSVLGANAAVTASVEFVNKEQACLTIVWRGEGISEEEKLQIQGAANAIIQKSVAITHSPMERKAAEQKYSAHPVNHTYIYDKFPVPDHVTQLKILEIADWNVNACSFEGHCKTTAELKALKILKSKRRHNKHEYEFEFCVGDKALQQLQKEASPSVSQAASSSSSSTSSSTSSSSLSSSAAAAAALPTETKSKRKAAHSNSEQKHVDDWKSLYRPSDMTLAASEILEDMVAPFLKSISASHDAAALHALFADERNVQSLLRSKLLSSVEQYLQLYGNMQYTKGFQSKSYTQPSMQSLLSEGKK